jgi:hypothetical protein
MKKIFTTERKGVYLPRALFFWQRICAAEQLFSRRCAASQRKIPGTAASVRGGCLFCPLFGHCRRCSTMCAAIFTAFIRLFGFA